MRPRTFLQCFALDSRCSTAKHCRNVLGRVLNRTKNLGTKPLLKFRGEVPLVEQNIIEYVLCDFLVRTLQYLYKKKYFFAYENMKQLPSKVAHCAHN